MELNILKDRYLIGDLLGQGSSSVIYKVINLKNDQRPLAIKLSTNIENFSQETKIA